MHCLFCNELLEDDPFITDIAVVRTVVDEARHCSANPNASYHEPYDIEDDVRYNDEPIADDDLFASR